MIPEQFPDMAYCEFEGTTEIQTGMEKGCWVLTWVPLLCCKDKVWGEIRTGGSQVTG